MQADALSGVRKHLTRAVPHSSPSPEGWWPAFSARIGADPGVPGPQPEIADTSLAIGENAGLWAQQLSTRQYLERVGGAGAGNLALAEATGVGAVRNPYAPSPLARERRSLSDSPQMRLQSMLRELLSAVDALDTQSIPPELLLDLSQALWQITDELNRVLEDSERKEKGVA